MEMIDVAFLSGLMLMVTALVLMYICLRRKSRRQRLERLTDSLSSTKNCLDYQMSRFNSLMDEMASDNKRDSILKSHAERLEELVGELECKRDVLDAENRLMTGTNTELKRSNADLVERATHLRNEISLNEQTICDMEQQIDTLKSIREGLEIALGNVPAAEVHYLAQPVFSLGITPSVRSQLESHGILYIGDLIRLDEQYLMEIWGIGPVTLERIKAKLNENKVWFGMDVIRIENHWYRRKQEPTRE